jgi:hypothetical protein
MAPLSAIYFQIYKMTIPIGRNLRQSGKLRETVPATGKSLTKYEVFLAFSCTIFFFIISNFWSIFSTKFEVIIIYNEPKNETKYNSNNFTEKNEKIDKIEMKIIEDPMEYGIEQITHNLSK